MCLLRFGFGLRRDMRVSYMLIVDYVGFGYDVACPLLVTLTESNKPDLSCKQGICEIEN